MYYVLTGTGKFINKNYSSDPKGFIRIEAWTKFRSDVNGNPLIHVGKKRTNKRF